MTTLARILTVSLLVLAVAGCGGKSAAMACHTAAQCLDDWRTHYDERASEWLQANPLPSRRLAIKLLLSTDYRDRELGTWLVSLAKLDNDLSIHQIVAPSLELGPEAAAIYKTPRSLLPSLDETMRLVVRAPPRSNIYAGLAGKFGMDAVMAVEQRLRCRPACELLDPAQASTILSSARTEVIFKRPLSASQREAMEKRILAPIAALAEDTQASDAARLEAASLLASQLGPSHDYSAGDALASLLRRKLASDDAAMREQALHSILMLGRPLSGQDWNQIAEVIQIHAIPLDAVAWHLTRDLPEESFRNLLIQRLSGEDTRDASIALQLLSHTKASSNAERDSVRELLSNADPALAARSARALLHLGMPAHDIRRLTTSHWFPATPEMFGEGISSRDHYRAIRNSNCRTKPQRLSTIVVKARPDRRLLRRASRYLQTDVSHAVSHGDIIVASVSHGEFGGYLAVLRDGRPPEILGHEAFGPLLHLGGNRFLATSGLAHMGSLAGNVYELQVGPTTSKLTHRLGELSEPLALEERRGRVLLSTYAFGIMDLTDLSAPKWLGCQCPPDTPMRP